MIFWSPAECACAKNAHHHHLIFFFSVPDPVLYIPVRPVCLLLLRSPSFQRDVRLCQTGLPGSTAPCGTKIYAWWVIGIDHDTVCAGVVGSWYCNPEQHELCRPSRGRAGRHNECCSGLQYQPRQCRPYKWSISILPRSQFTKSKGNLRFQCLVPLFVPIGVCVTTHDDRTASDVTIGMWRHNQQVTNHERNGKPWFSLPK